MKKFTALLLSVSVFLAVLPTYVFAAVPEITATAEPTHYLSDGADGYTATAFANRYFSSASSSQEKALKTAIADAISNHEDEKDISNIALEYSKENGEYIFALIQQVIDQNPLLYTSKQFSYKAKYDEKSEKYIFNSISFKYIITKAEYNSQISQCETAANKLISDIKNVRSKLTDAQVVTLVHDRLADYCEYDVATFEQSKGGRPYDELPVPPFNIYGTLINHSAVCQGYSQTFVYLMNKLGINAYYVSSDELAHAWNAVQIGDKYYYVDITYDDKVPDIDGSFTHDYLLNSHSLFHQSHTADDFVSSIDIVKKATDKTYDRYFWHNSNTGIHLVGTTLYYVDNKNQTVNSWNGKSTAELFSVEEKWQANPHAYYEKNYVKLGSIDGKLYYSLSRNIYSYDISKKKTAVAYSPDLSIYESDYYFIYGFSIRDNTMYCDIFNSPNFEDDTKLKYRITVDFQSDPTFDIDKTDIISTQKGEKITVKVINFNNGGFGATEDEIVWSSSKPTVATVKDGLVTTVSSGVSIISCDLGSVHRECKITVALDGKIAVTPANSEISGVDDEYNFTGSPVNLSPSVKVDGQTVTDYTVKYPSGHTNVGLTVATVVFSGDYVGELEIVFHIVPSDITEAIEDSLQPLTKQEFIYNGKAQKISISPEYGGKTLVLGTDYSITYKNNTNEGTAVATIKGIGNYFGTVEVSFTIYPRDINDCTFEIMGNVVYTGSAIPMPVTVKYGTKTLNFGTDYILHYKNNIKMGKASVTVEGINNYEGCSPNKYFYICPDAVTGHNVISVTKTSITISWKKSSGVAGYIIERATTKTGKMTTVKTVSASTVKFTNKSLKAGGKYYYRIVPYITVDGKKVRGISGSVLGVPTPTLKPKTPTAANKKAKTAVISWKKVSGATGYELYMSTSKNGAYKKIYSGSKTTYTKKKLKKGKTYYFKVRSCNKVGNIKALSVYSGKKKLKIKK